MQFKYFKKVNLLHNSLLEAIAGVVLVLENRFLVSMYWKHSPSITAILARIEHCRVEVCFFESRRSLNYVRDVMGYLVNRLGHYVTILGMVSDHREHDIWSSWAWCLIILVKMSDHLGHNVWPSWSQCPTILVTMSDHLGHNVRPSWSPCPIILVTMPDHLDPNVNHLGHDAWRSRAWCLTILGMMSSIFGTMYDHLRCNVDHLGMMTDHYEYNVLNLGHDDWPWVRRLSIFVAMSDQLWHNVRSSWS
jgi:hypothetical protein